MVRTAGAIRISGGKSSKKSSGGAPTNSSGSNKSSGSSGSHASGNRLPPIPHTDVPAWQKPITNFFNSGGLKSKDKNSDPDEKTEQDTGSSKAQQKSNEKCEPTQSSTSSCNPGMETDHQEKTLQTNNEPEKNIGEDSSVNEDQSNKKSVNDSLEEVPQKSPPASPIAEKVTYEENEPVNENSVEADIGSAKKHKVQGLAAPSSVEDATMGSEVEQKDVLDVSNKSDSDAKNESESITEASGEASDKENRSVSPVGGNCAERKNSCQEDDESGDGEKNQAEEKYDGEPAAKKIKT
nr:unnamed protein product [Callosobruchus chinensis]